jgi:hypothetical protein
MLDGWASWGATCCAPTTTEIAPRADNEPSGYKKTYKGGRWAARSSCGVKGACGGAFDEGGGYVGGGDGEHVAAWD